MNIFIMKINTNEDLYSFLNENLSPKKFPSEKPLNKKNLI